jgi:catechol 2,3-dioxygenase
MSAAALPDGLRLGHLELTVSDLDRSVAFYQESLGLRPRRREESAAVMGTDERDLVALVEEPGARPAGRHAGLYHFALLFPTREDLARALARVAATRTPIEGAADHGVSEAIYLPDPDGNGIELYADRPRDRWPGPDAGMKVGMYTIALDLQGLLDVAGGDVPQHAAPGLVLGHVHLHVGDVAEAVAFYGDVLGFELMARLPGAAFVAAGGYHHHLGVNTWRGQGVGPPPPRTVGVREWVVVLEDAADVDAVRERVAAAGLPVEDAGGRSALVRDPWQLAVRFQTASAS